MSTSIFTASPALLIPEFHPKSGLVVFFPRVAAKTATDDEERLGSELHVQFPFRQRPLEARLVVPAGTLPLDFRNLRQKLYDPTGALEISTILEGLPDSFQLGVHDSLAPISAVASPDTLRALAQEAFERGLALELSWSFELEEAELDPSASGAEAAAVTDALVALATVGELFAWSEENAYVNPHVANPLEGRAEPAKRVASDKRSRDKSERPRRETPAPSVAQAENDPPRVDDPAPRATAPVPTPFAFPRRTPLKSSSSSSTPAELPQELAPGARVQVAGGPFLGRLGIVQSVDAAKGQTRVLFGLLAATIATSDLVTVRAPGKRPRLSSSHRRLPSKE